MFSLPWNKWQGEGFSYLGIGIIILLCCALVGIIVNTSIRVVALHNKFLLISIIVFVMISVMISLSNRITIGTSNDFTIYLPDFIVRTWSLFRATGRLVWPLYYLVFLFAIVFAWKVLPKRIGTFVLTICLLLQIIDLYPLLSGKRVDGSLTYSSGLEDSKWAELIDRTETKHLDLIGMDNTDFEFPCEYQMGIIATKSNVTMNRFRMSHGQLKYRDQVDEIIALREEGHLFLFKEYSEVIKYPQLQFYYFDSWIIGSLKGTEAEKALDRVPGVVPLDEELKGYTADVELELTTSGKYLHLRDGWSEITNNATWTLGDCSNFDLYILDESKDYTLIINVSIDMGYRNVLYVNNQESGAIITSDKTAKIENPNSLLVPGFNSFSIRSMDEIQIHPEAHRKLNLFIHSMLLKTNDGLSGIKAN